MKKLLLVIDYQNDFIDGTLGFKGAQDITKGIVNRVKHYVQNKQDIVFTMDTHNKNYLTTLEGKSLPIKHAIVNTRGWQLHQDLLPYVKYGTIITKDTFGAKTLFNYFNKHKYQQVEIIGVVTNLCVLANAIITKSCLPNANIIIYKKLIAAPNKKLHYEAINLLKHSYFKII